MRFATIRLAVHPIIAFIFRALRDRVIAFDSLVVAFSNLLDGVRETRTCRSAAVDPDRSRK